MMTSRFNLQFLAVKFAEVARSLCAPYLTSDALLTALETEISRAQIDATGGRDVFGQNPIADVVPKGTYTVTEIFHTIQGEGPYAGQPAMFVRFTGCNLRCLFCDTYFERGTTSTLDQLVARIAQERNPAWIEPKLIVLTGGEPFLHDLTPLITHPALADRRFQIETAGTINPHGNSFDLITATNLHVVCSPKTPKVSMLLLPRINSWKYIIREGCIDEGDGLPNRSTQLGKFGRDTSQRIFRPFDLPGTLRPKSCNNIYVQPCDEGEDVAATKRNTQLAAHVAMKFGYTLSLQTHKIVGLP